MSKCIKTGLNVFIEEMQGVVRADLHLMELDHESIIIIQYNPTSILYGEAEYDMAVFIADGYHRPREGTLIISEFNCNEGLLKYYTRS
jgi:hypothetical protein